MMSYFDHRIQEHIVESADGEYVLGREKLFTETTSDRVVKKENGDKYVDLSVHNEKPYGLDLLKEAVTKNPWLGCDYHIEPGESLKFAKVINKFIDTDDHFIFLGDFDARHHDPDFNLLKTFFGALKCRNVYLILGNNDSFPIRKYKELGIRAVTDTFEFENVVMTHFPVDVKAPKINIHGHLHGAGSPTQKGPKAYWHADPKRCVDVWRDDFTPLRLNDVLTNWKKMQKYESHYDGKQHLIGESVEIDDYGIPELKKYPLDTKQHVISAIKLFGHVDKEHEQELADNIIKKIEYYNLKDEVSVGDDNRFKKYFDDYFSEEVLDELRGELFEESLETFLTTNPLEKTVTLYHGSIGKFDVIKPLRLNVGTKLSNPRNSSFWGTDPHWCKAYALQKLISENSCEALLNTVMKAIYPKDKIKEDIICKESEKSSVEQALRTGKIYLYSKTMEKKYLGIGHNACYPEYSVDFDVKPDSVEELKYRDFKDISIKYVSDEEYESFVEILKEIVKKNKKYGRGRILKYTDQERTEIRNKIKGYKESAEDVITEEADYNQKNMYPVYIILTDADSPMAKMIKRYTGQPYAHALISFNEDLEPAYSFGCTSIKPLKFGFISKGEEDPFRNEEKAAYVVYAMYVTKSQYVKIQKRIQWFIDNKDKLDYAWGGLAFFGLQIPKQFKNQYFCSQFVMQIIGEVVPLSKDPSLWSPGDIEYLTNISLVDKGDDLRKFDKKRFKKNLNYLKHHQFNRLKMALESGDVIFEEKVDSKFKFMDFKSPGAVSYLENGEKSYWKKYGKWHLKNSIGEIVVDSEKDALAGYILVDNKASGQEGFITPLMVIKQYRKNGLGNKLLEDAIRKYNAIDLVVLRSNTVAYNMYKKHGFVVIGKGNEKNSLYMKLRSKLTKDDTIIEESGDYFMEAEETLNPTTSHFLLQKIGKRVDAVLADPKNVRTFVNLVQNFINRNITKLTKSGPCDMIPFTDTDHEAFHKLFGFWYTIDPRANKTSPNEIRDIIDEYSKRAHIKCDFWKNNSSLMLFYFVIRYFTMKNDSKNLNTALAIYTLCNYPVMFHKYFPNGVMEPYMQYTIDNMTEKFIIKKSKHLFDALMTSIQASYKFHKGNFASATDKKVGDWINRIRNDQNSMMKKISNEYMKNYKAGNAARTSNEEYDGDTPIVDELENGTTVVQNLVQRVTLPIIEDGVDLVRAEAAAKMSQVSVSDCRYFLTLIITDSNADTIQKFIECLLFLYIYEGKKTERDIRSQYFLAWSASLFKKTNSKNKNINTINEILNFWAESTGLYKKFAGKTSRINYKKAIFFYLVLCIQKNV